VSRSVPSWSAIFLRLIPESSSSFGFCFFSLMNVPNRRVSSMTHWISRNILVDVDMLEYEVDIFSTIDSPVIPVIEFIFIVNTTMFMTSMSTTTKSTLKKIGFSSFIIL